MKSFFQSLMARKGARAAAFGLSCLFLALGIFFAQGARYAWNRDWYTGGSTDFADTVACEDYINTCNRYVLEYVQWQGDIEDAVVFGYSGEAYACQVINHNTGEVILDTTGADSVAVAGDMSATWYSDDKNLLANWDEEKFQAELAAALAAEDPEVLAELEQAYIPFTVKGFINLPVEPYAGCYTEYWTHHFMLSLSRWAIPGAVASYLLFALLAVLLVLRTACWQKPEEASFLARIPADALGLGLALAVFLCQGLWAAMLTAILAHVSLAWPVYDALIAVLAKPFVQSFLWTAAALTLAIVIIEQLRQGAFRRRLMLGRAPIFRRIGLILCLMELLGLVLTLWITNVFTGFYGLSGLLLALMALGLVGLWLVYLSSQQMQKLRRAMDRLAEGELESPVDAAALPPGLREPAESLNRIGDGLQKAVEERLKGERFKTELITNVSHDLKTPLTSIVSYVDLLKKGDVPPEQAKEYIEVIERQSAKLKKLTDDLVEASKASSGVVEVHKEPVDVAELLSQSVGEFTKRLENAGIEPVLSLPEEKCLWESDGRLLWRVLDNLIQNIVKYGQPGTRAYFDLTRTKTGLLLELKNTSAQPLNIPADMLMERFIRGDSARHSEGSGLGLSIAQSFTELLGGKMELYLDGDLFKVSLRFEGGEE